MPADPQRLRDQLVRSVDEDGLEELVVRLARKTFPDAHSTRQGTDGGIDVLSDLTLTPARGWQCKTSTDGRVKWDPCRKSLASAMARDVRPKRYTFVFNHKLTDGQRNFWRDEFVPKQQELFPELFELDYCDDVAARIEPHPEIVEWLLNGALSPYLRSTLELTAETGVNPLASAVDVADGLSSVSKMAKAVGKDDPRYAYRTAGGELSAGDADLKDMHVQFSMSAGQLGAVPEFKLTVRRDDGIEEVSAKPRPGIEVVAPSPMFADTPGGQEAHTRARRSLAFGEPITLTGPDVGVSGGDTPDRFRGWLEETNTTGELEIGLSEPAELRVTLHVPGVGTGVERITLYRVPPMPGAESAYAGNVGGTVLSIDLVDTGRPAVNGEGAWIEASLALSLDIGGRPAENAVKGLAFSRAFTSATHRHLDAPGIFPTPGLAIDAPFPMGDEEGEIWQAGFIIATALARLQRRDGISRTVPMSVGVADLKRAELVLMLLEGAETELRVAAGSEFHAPLPPQFQIDDPPESGLRFTSELPALAGQPTGLVVEQVVEGAVAVEIESTDRGTLALRCEANDGGATISMRLTD